MSLIGNMWAIVLLGAGCDPYTENRGKPDPKDIRSSDSLAKKLPSNQRPAVCGANLVGGRVSTSDEGNHVGLILSRRGSTLRHCTGTWVSDSTMITASHCVWDTPNGDVYFIPGSGFEYSSVNIDKAWEKRIAPEKAIIGAVELTQGKVNSDFKLRSMDLAVLIFPPGTAPSYVPVVEAAASASDRLTLYGFGSIKAPSLRNDDEPVKDLLLRKGNNLLIDEEVARLQSWGKEFYAISGDSSSDGKTATGRAILGLGDSGGPLLVGCGLVGVAVLSEAVADYKAGGLAKSLHASLNSDFSKNFLMKAETQGAKITRAKDVAVARKMQNGKALLCEEDSGSSLQNVQNVACATP